MKNTTLFICMYALAKLGTERIATKTSTLILCHLSLTITCTFRQSYRSSYTLKLIFITLTLEVILIHLALLPVEACHSSLVLII